MAHDLRESRSRVKLYCIEYVVGSKRRLSGGLLPEMALQASKVVLDRVIRRVLRKVVEHV